MKCLLCSNQTKTITRKYCSVTCSRKSMYGRKRPDLAIRNKVNNPMSDRRNVEKMRLALTGREQSDEEKLKRARSLKKYYADNPEAKAKLAQNVWDKYTSKIAGTGWQKISKRIRERDHYTCQQCQKTDKKLLVHHIDWKGKRRGVPTHKWNNEDSNLVTLCYKCHNSIHRHKSNDYLQRREAAQSQ